MRVCGAPQIRLELFPTIATSVKPTAHSGDYRTMKLYLIDTTIAMRISHPTLQPAFYRVAGGLAGSL
jgi:hypothetical protein